MTISLTSILMLEHTDNYFLLLVQLVSYFAPLSSCFCCASSSNLIFSLPLCVLLSPEVNEELPILRSCYLTMFLIFHAKWKIMYVLTTHVFKESLPPFGFLISQTSFLEYSIFQMFEFTEVYFPKIHHFCFVSIPPRLPLPVITVIYLTFCLNSLSSLPKPKIKSGILSSLVVGVSFPQFVSKTSSVHFKDLLNNLCPAIFFSQQKSKQLKILYYY